ncbi:MAG: Fur family transcriptional regulator, ferric uptake regulator [Kosmotogales bacterium]|nr:Fur family transcriptional regulator, ferric uptake regulator [Kosmotogales bacterium]
MQQDVLRSELRRRKQRMTAQRELVLKAFADTDAEHLSSEEVYRKVLEKRLRISKATVFRTVELLAEVGILRKIVFRDGIVRYELVEDTENEEQQIICNQCGKAFDFSLDKINDLLKSAEEKTGFKIEEVQIKFYGLCPECQERLERIRKATNSAHI